MQSLNFSLALLLVVTGAVLAVVVCQVRVCTSELVDPGLRKLPGGNIVFEQDVHLTVCASVRLNQTEVMINEDEETDAGPKEA